MECSAPTEQLHTAEVTHQLRAEASSGDEPACSDEINAPDDNCRRRRKDDERQVTEVRRRGRGEGNKEDVNTVNTGASWLSCEVNLRKIPQVGVKMFLHVDQSEVLSFSWTQIVSGLL